MAGERKSVNMLVTLRLESPGKHIFTFSEVGSCSGAEAAVAAPGCTPRWLGM